MVSVFLAFAILPPRRGFGITTFPALTTTATSRRRGPPTFAFNFMPLHGSVDNPMNR